MPEQRKGPLEMTHTSNDRSGFQGRLTPWLALSGVVVVDWGSGVGDHEGIDTLFQRISLYSV